MKSRNALSARSRKRCQREATSTNVSLATAFDQRQRRRRQSGRRSDCRSESHQLDPLRFRTAPRRAAERRHRRRSSARAHRGTRIVCACAACAPARTDRARLPPPIVCAACASRTMKRSPGLAQIGASKTSCARPDAPGAIVGGFERHQMRAAMRGAEMDVQRRPAPQLACAHRASRLQAHVDARRRRRTRADRRASRRARSRSFRRRRDSARSARPARPRRRRDSARGCCARGPARPDGITSAR